MKLGKRTFGGVKYDLTHLDPLTVTVPCPQGQGPDINVRVQFGSHVFTKAWSPGHPADMQHMDGRTPRCFCPDRYGHSLHLAGVVERGLNGRILISPQKKFVLLGNPPGILHPYSIFFLMRPLTRPPFQAMVDVVSAYERPQLASMSGKGLGEILAAMNAKRFAWPKKK